MFIKILVGWSGCVYRTKTQTHNGKMETKLLYQQSGCDVKRSSQIRTTQNIVFEQSRNRWGGRVFISISLSLQLFSRFLGPFSSQLFSLTPLENNVGWHHSLCLGINFAWNWYTSFPTQIIHSQYQPVIGFIVSNLTNAFYNICTSNIHIFSTRIVDFSTNIQF